MPDLVCYGPINEKSWTVLPVNFTLEEHLSSHFLKDGSEKRHHARLIEWSMLPGNNGKGVENWVWQEKADNHMGGIKSSG